MMRKVIFSVIFFLAVSVVLFRNSSSPYWYACITFQKDEMNVVFQGQASPDSCKALFESFGSYTGSSIDIPDDTKIFGSLIISCGEETKALPLYTWTSKEGKTVFGCNFPPLAFARFEDQNAFLQSIVQFIER